MSFNYFEEPNLTYEYLNNLKKRCESITKSMDDFINECINKYKPKIYEDSLKCDEDNQYWNSSKDPLELVFSACESDEASDIKMLSSCFCTNVDLFNFQNKAPYIHMNVELHLNDRLVPQLSKNDLENRFRNVIKPFNRKEMDLLLLLCYQGSSLLSSGQDLAYTKYKSLTCSFDLQSILIDFMCFGHVWSKKYIRILYAILRLFEEYDK